MGSGQNGNGIGPARRRSVERSASDQFFIIRLVVLTWGGATHLYGLIRKSDMIIEIRIKYSFTLVPSPFPIFLGGKWVVASHE